LLYLLFFWCTHWQGKTLRFEIENGLCSVVLTRDRYENTQRAPGNFGIIEVPVLGSDIPVLIPISALAIDDAATLTRTLNFI